jgi:hypothetical protein
MYKVGRRLLHLSPPFREEDKKLSNFFKNVFLFFRPSSYYYYVHRGNISNTGYLALSFEKIQRNTIPPLSLDLLNNSTHTHQVYIAY